LSDLVFVGGSLVPIGGHNILEAAILGKAIFTGPYMQNARKVMADFIAQHAAIQLQTDTELTSTISKLLHNPQQCKTLGKNAAHLIEKNRGVVCKLVEMVKRLTT